MDVCSDVVKKIDDLSSQLLKPLAAGELKNGWTEKNQNVVLNFFKGIRECILKGECVGNIHVSRRLDAWGIGEGPLSEFAEGIGQAVENSGKSERP